MITEIDQLESRLRYDATDVIDQQNVGKHIEIIEQLADQAAIEGHYGLQDVCLLIVEALGQASVGGFSPELLTVLETFLTLFNEYGSGSCEAVQEIIDILSYPALQIELADDELAMLESQLTAEVVIQDELDLMAVDDEEALGLDRLDISADAVAESLSKAVLELVELLNMEAALIEQLLAAITLGDHKSVADSLEQISDELERYISASQMAGFEGLALICGQVNANIQFFREDIAAFSADQLDLLQTWIGNVKVYLSVLNEPDAGLQLLAHTASPDWPLPINLDAADEILGHLQSNGSNIADEQQEPRKQFATPEDIALDLPDDVNQELLDILLHELPVQTQQFSTAIQSLYAGGGLADLEVAQRVAHTVKGAANTVGIKGIAQLTHYLEDILVACTETNTLPVGELLNVLIDAADCLEGMVEFITGFASPPEDALMVLQTVLDWANRIDQVGIQQINADCGSQADVELIGSPGADITETIDRTLISESPEKSQATMVRVAAEQMENLFRQAGENIILNSQATERLRCMKKQLQAMQAQFEVLRRLGDEMEQLIDLRDLSGRSLINVGTGFDALEMDQYNELHTASRRMVEAAFDVREMTQDAGKYLEEMGRLLEDQQRVVNEIQEVIMKTRLVPVSSIAHRLQRGLRQTCRLTGKQCDLNLSGEHLLVDGDTLNAMIEPLMHLLRNAVDHGIESEAERLASDKPKTGQISIEFNRESNTVLVRCRDDGRGLDFGAIRAAAEKRGVIEPGQAVSEEELKRFILQPNFSTRSQTTQVSGRGVGMDAVHFQVLELGGTLALHSTPGQGLSVELKIPLPLSRAHALLVNAGPYRVAIVSKGIRQILYPDAGQVIALANDKQVLLLDGVTYPVTTLRSLLHIPEQRMNSRPGAILLIENDDKVTAVQLDTIMGSLDVVIKNFGYYIKKIPGFAGAAILGDGSVTPVLDLPELLRFATSDTEFFYQETSDNEEPEQSLPMVLVVDDSLSQRRALEQLLADVGFRTRSARDGVEATEMLVHCKPDMVLTDLEMPRMNGIELTAHIRGKENLKEVPVIMITSRTTQKHRTLAEETGVDFYLTKPVREDDLLIKMQNLLKSRDLKQFMPHR